MTLSLFYQLLATFVIGGCFIAFLTILAEKSNENIAGIILMFPSTIVMGFLFLGLATSPEKVAHIIPATLIPLGMVVFSSVIYIYTAIFLSQYFTSKRSQILTTICTSSCIWFILASPFAIWKFSDLSVGILGFLSLVVLSHYILTRSSRSEILQKPSHTKLQMITRAVFTGLAVSAVVYMGKSFGPFWGGIFTMYPAATFTSLMIFHFYYEPKQLSRFMKKAPIGSLSLLVYTLSVMFLFPKYGIGFGTLLSYLSSLMFSLVLLRFNFKRNAKTKRSKSL